MPLEPLYLIDEAAHLGDGFGQGLVEGMDRAFQPLQKNGFLDSGQVDFGALLLLPLVVAHPGQLALPAFGRGRLAGLHQVVGRLIYGQRHFENGFGDLGIVRFCPVLSRDGQLRGAVIRLGPFRECAKLFAKLFKVGGVGIFDVLPGAGYGNPLQ